MRVLVVFSVLTIALAAAPSSAAASPTGTSAAGDVASGGAQRLTASSPAACADTKYAFLGPSSAWRQTLNWSFRSSSVPAGLGKSAVLDVIKKSFQNVTTARNDCGRADHVGAASHYLGTTTRKPGVTANGTCKEPDGHNVVGFGPLDGFYSGYTCIWWIGNEITEADMRLDTDTQWALNAGSCSAELMMEALVTHEVGHAFGLAHVAENNHGRQTMSVYIDGLCENQEATLGLGDMMGLEALY